jgi:hypothetical protein
MRPRRILALFLAAHLAGCTHPTRSTQPPSRSPVELEILAPATGARGRFNIPVHLASSPNDPAAPTQTAIGPFEILEVRYDNTSWTCEWPARWCRVRTLEGDPVEGWTLLGRW